MGSALERLDERGRAWGVTIEHTLETESSLVAFGTRARQAVVLKILKQPGDEWHAGASLAAFAGSGATRLYQHSPGAQLLERVRPGHSLASKLEELGDDHATEILAELIRQLSGRDPPEGCPTVAAWGKGFERYTASGADQIPRELVAIASREYSALCMTQRKRQLLHGDLQHYNVLFDASRGWLAIDPKGVSGELEYEIGALLRNPAASPELYARPETVQRRLAILTDRLQLARSRAMRWAFSQAVLSAIWQVEDGHRVDEGVPVLRLARVMLAMLRD